MRKLDSRVRGQILRELKKTPPPSKHSLARKYGISATTVRGIARDGGLTIAAQSPQLAAATDAGIIERRSKRSALSQRLLESAGEFLRLAMSPAIVSAYDQRRGKWVEHVMPHASPKEIQSMQISMAVAIDKHLALEKYDAEGPQAARAAIVSLVDQLHEEADVESRRAQRPGGAGGGRAKAGNGRAPRPRPPAPAPDPAGAAVPGPDDPTA